MVFYARLVRPVTGRSGATYSVGQFFWVKEEYFGKLRVLDNIHDKEELVLRKDDVEAVIADPCVGTREAKRWQ